MSLAALVAPIVARGCSPPCRPGLAAIVALNRDFYRFLARRRGLGLRRRGGPAPLRLLLLLRRLGRDRAGALAPLPPSPRRRTARRPRTGRPQGPARRGDGPADRTRHGHGGPRDGPGRERRRRPRRQPPRGRRRGPGADRRRPPAPRRARGPGQAEPGQPPPPAPLDPRRHPLGHARRPARRRAPAASSSPRGRATPRPASTGSASAARRSAGPSRSSTSTATRPTGSRSSCPASTARPAVARLSRTVATAPCRVSLALAKTHVTSMVTLSLKNMLSSIHPDDRVMMHGHAGGRQRLLGLEAAGRRVPQGGQPRSSTLLTRPMGRVRNARTALRALAGRDGFEALSAGRARLPPVGRGDEPQPRRAVAAGRAARRAWSTASSAMHREGPRHGTPIRLGTVIAGTDAVAVDAVAAAVMGFDPRQVGYLRYAEAAGLGVADLDAIAVVGDPIARSAAGSSRTRTTRSSATGTASPRPPSPRPHIPTRLGREDRRAMSPNSDKPARRRRRRLDRGARDRPRQPRAVPRRGRPAGARWSWSTPRATGRPTRPPAASRDVRVLRRPPGRLAPELWRDGLDATDAPLVAFSTAADGPGRRLARGPARPARRDRRGGGRRADRAGGRACRPATGRSTCSGTSTTSAPCPTRPRSSRRATTPSIAATACGGLEACWERGFWEAEVHRALRDRGERLAMADEAAVAFRGGMPPGADAPAAPAPTRGATAPAGRAGWARRQRLARSAAAPAGPRRAAPADRRRAAGAGPAARALAARPAPTVAPAGGLGGWARRGRLWGMTAESMIADGQTATGRGGWHGRERARDGLPGRGGGVPRGAPGRGDHGRARVPAGRRPRPRPRASRRRSPASTGSGSRPTTTTALALGRGRRRRRRHAARRPLRAGAPGAGGGQARPLREAADDPARRGARAWRPWPTSSRLRLATGLNHRFYPPVRDALALVGSWAIGRVEAVRAEIGHMASPEFLRSWHTDVARSGGGTLMDNGPHACDLVRRFLGEVVAVEGSVCDAFGLPAGCETEAYRPASATTTAASARSARRGPCPTGYLTARGPRHRGPPPRRDRPLAAHRRARRPAGGSASATSPSGSPSAASAACSAASGRSSASSRRSSRPPWRPAPARGDRLGRLPRHRDDRRRLPLGPDRARRSRSSPLLVHLPSRAPAVAAHRERRA